MEIWYLGQGTFRLRTKEGIIIINPYNNKVGLKKGRDKKHIFLFSKEHFGYKAIQFHSSYQLISLRAPGEYEIEGITIIALTTMPSSSPEGRNLAFLIDSEGVKICHLGYPSLPLKEEILNQLNSPDILFLPVDHLSSTEALKVAKQLEAKIIIPITTPENDSEKENAAIQKFLKNTAQPYEKKEKLVIKKNDLNFEGEKIMLISKRK